MVYPGKDTTSFFVLDYTGLSRYGKVHGEDIFQSIVRIVSGGNKSPRLQTLGTQELKSNFETVRLIGIRWPKESGNSSPFPGSSICHCHFHPFSFWTVLILKCLLSSFSERDVLVVILPYPLVLDGACSQAQVRLRTRHV